MYRWLAKSTCMQHPYLLRVFRCFEYPCFETVDSSPSIPGEDIEDCAPNRNVINRDQALMRTSRSKSLKRVNSLRMAKFSKNASVLVTDVDMALRESGDSDYDCLVTWVDFIGEVGRVVSVHPDRVFVKLTSFPHPVAFSPGSLKIISGEI